MRVLWITETPAEYDISNRSYNGRGWIGALQKLIQDDSRISEFGIIFPHENDDKLLRINNTIYYPIKRNIPTNFFSWIISNWKNKIFNQFEIETLKKYIEDFSPDIIHVFGTESWLLQSIELTNIPCVVHLQGILQPIQNAYYPIGITKISTIKYDIISFLKGNSIWHYKRILDARTKIEEKYICNVQYFMGRTDWDKTISNFLSPNAKYFRVNEVLRPIFYNINEVNTKYENSNKNKISLISTISNAPYKGLDVIIKTAILLKNKNIDFEWNIVGITESQTFTKYLTKLFKIEYSNFNINILGVKNEIELTSLLVNSSLYIHTSYIDNSPNSVCEAQILGIPVISTNVGGISTLIENNLTGFLYAANDPFHLASLIVNTFNNKETYKRIADKGKKIAQQRHDKNIIKSDLLKSYQEIIKLAKK